MIGAQAESQIYQLLFVHEEGPPVCRRHSESLGRLPESRMESYGLPPTAAEQPSQTVQCSVILSRRPASRGIPRLACAADFPIGPLIRTAQKEKRENSSGKGAGSAGFCFQLRHRRRPGGKGWNRKARAF